MQRKTHHIHIKWQLWTPFYKNRCVFTKELFCCSCDTHSIVPIFNHSSEHLKTKNKGRRENQTHSSHTNFVLQNRQISQKKTFQRIHAALKRYKDLNDFIFNESISSWFLQRYCLENSHDIKSTIQIKEEKKPFL